MEMPDVVETLNGVTRDQLNVADTQRSTEAQLAVEEALVIFRDLASRNPAAYQDRIDSAAALVDLLRQSPTIRGGARE
jgi:hypothetical protein